MMPPQDTLSQGTPQAVVAFAARSGAVFTELLPDFIRAVQAQEFEVLCCCPLDRFTTDLEQLRVTHIKVPLAPRPELMRDAVAWLLMTSACIEHRPLLMHSLDATLHLTAAFAARSAQVPIVVATTVDHQPQRVWPGLDGWLTSACHSYLQHAARRTDAWIVHNAHQASLAKNAIGIPDEDILLLDGGLGVGLHRFSPGLERSTERDRARALLKLDPEYSHWVGYVGALDRRHSTPLMPIVDALAQQSPTTGVVIVPHGELDPVILAETQARLDYGRRVVVLADRSMDERALVYRALDAMVAPVSSPGMHRSLLEALAMRLPVVAYDHPSIRGWIADRQTGRVVAVGDRSALVQALLEVLGDRRLRRNMGAMARKAAEHRFDSESNRLRLFALYDALIRRNLVDP